MDRTCRRPSVIQVISVFPLYLKVLFGGDGIHCMNTGEYPRHLISSSIEDSGGGPSLDFIQNAWNTETNARILRRPSRLLLHSNCVADRDENSQTD